MDNLSFDSSGDNFEYERLKGSLEFNNLPIDKDIADLIEGLDKIRNYTSPKEKKTIIDYINNNCPGLIELIDEIGKTANIIRQSYKKINAIEKEQSDIIESFNPSTDSCSDLEYNFEKLDLELKHEKENICNLHDKISECSDEVKSIINDKLTLVGFILGKSESYLSENISSNEDIFVLKRDDILLNQERFPNGNKENSSMDQIEVQPDILSKQNIDSNINSENQKSMVEVCTKFFKWTHDYINGFLRQFRGLEITFPEFKNILYYNYIDKIDIERLDFLGKIDEAYNVGLQDDALVNRIIEINKDCISERTIQVLDPRVLTLVKKINAMRRDFNESQQNLKEIANRGIELRRGIEEFNEKFENYLDSGLNIDELKDEYEKRRDAPYLLEQDYYSTIERLASIRQDYDDSCKELEKIIEEVFSSIDLFNTVSQQNVVTTNNTLDDSERILYREENTLSTNDDDKTTIAKMLSPLRFTLIKRALDSMSEEGVKILNEDIHINLSQQIITIGYNGIKYKFNEREYIVLIANLYGHALFFLSAENFNLIKPKNKNIPTISKKELVKEPYEATKKNWIFGNESGIDREALNRILNVSSERNSLDKCRKFDYLFEYFGILQDNIRLVTGNIKKIIREIYKRDNLRS